MMANPLNQILGQAPAPMNNQSAQMVQSFQRMAQMLKGVKNPEAAMMQLAQQNPQVAQIMQMCQGKNPKEVFLQECQRRGIDVGAKYEIYCIIAELAKQGKGIIMISSEMSELIGMSDRVMVMCDGRVTGFVDGKEATQENIMALATKFE